jgi:hypothetical protein
MRISLPLPHSLGRLTRILAAFENARAGRAPEAGADPHFLDHRTDSRASASSDYRSDLEFLSLSRCEPVARPGPAARDELAAFGLCDAVSADGPASLRTVNQVSNGEGLESLALLRTEAQKPRRPESLADASPYDFLLYLGLMG